MMIIIVLLSLAFMLLIYNYYIQYNKDGRLINLIPGPPTVPIFGNALNWQTSSDLMWENYHKLCNEYYPIVRIWILFIPSVIIRHPDDMETILTSTKNIEKGNFYDLLHPWLGTGLLTSTGVKWQKRRKILTPTFHFNILRQFVDTLIEEGENIKKSLNNVEETVIKDLVSFVSEHTLNAICETAMGTSLREFGKFQEQYRQAVHEMGQILIYKLVRPWHFLFPSMARKQARLLKILHEFTEKIIAARKLYHEQTNGQYLKNFENYTESEINDKAKKKRLAMLDLLIAAYKENEITDLGMREEVDTFMFEGHDTTAMAITFALLLLAENKDIQDRVRTEVASALRETEDKFTMSSLQNLPYLDRCLKESLRLYPSVPTMIRQIVKDVTLQSYIVPAGTNVQLNVFDLHRDANFWPNPEAFEPDRFLADKITHRHPYSYLPFSAGPRNCIGQRFALLELKAMIAPLVYNFYLEPIDYLKDIKLIADLVIRPSQPINIKFIPVERIQLLNTNNS